ncbi:uncharacterized protein NH340_JMT02600 [Sarcoptes scabiei]|nr:uncharacterized protein NH340_JMT02600 [Sarcoptes scabiei]
MTSNKHRVLYSQISNQVLTLLLIAENFIRIVASPNKTIYQTPLMPNLLVDFDREHQNLIGQTIKLINIDFNNEGLYRCEVISDDLFQIDRKEFLLKVSTPIFDPPKIVAYRNQFRIGDLIRLRCITGISRSMPSIQWRIGNKQFNDRWLVIKNDIDDDDDDAHNQWVPINLDDFLTINHSAVDKLNKLKSDHHNHKRPSSSSPSTSTQLIADGNSNKRPTLFAKQIDRQSITKTKSIYQIGFRTFSDYNFILKSDHLSHQNNYRENQTTITTQTLITDHRKSIPSSPSSSSKSSTMLMKEKHFSVYCKSTLTENGIDLKQLESLHLHQGQRPKQHLHRQPPWKNNKNNRKRIDLRKNFIDSLSFMKTTTPVFYGLKQEYRIGELINVSCRLFDQTFHRTFRWKINHRTIHPKLIHSSSNQSWLCFRLTSDLLDENGRLKIECSSIQQPRSWQENEFGSSEMNEHSEINPDRNQNLFDDGQKFMKFFGPALLPITLIMTFIIFV